MIVSTWGSCPPGMQAGSVQSSGIAKEVNDVVRSFFAAARDRRALREDNETLNLNLVSAESGAAVSLREGDGYIRIRFADSKRPGCDLYVCSCDPDVVNIQYAGETFPDWYARLQEMRHFAVGLPEKSLYGWVERSIVTMLLTTNKNVYHNGVTFPAGLETYVLEGKRLPGVLRMDRSVDNASMRNWCQRFWVNVAAGNIVKLSSRARSLPGEMWVTCQDQQASITFDMPDGQQPLLMNGPYRFWYPREKHPGELDMLKGWSNSRTPLRNWFFPD